MARKRRYHRQAHRPLILDESLLLPVIVEDQVTGQEVTIAYDVKTLLEARTNDREMSGMLMADLRDSFEWGIVPVKAYKARRWIEQGRLLKRVAISRDGTLKNPRIRYTYSELKEWQSRLDEAEQAWLSALIEVDAVLSQEQVLRQWLGRALQGIAVVAAEVTRRRNQAKPKRTKRKKVKAKERRRKERERRASYV